MRSKPEFRFAMDDDLDWIFSSLQYMVEEGGLSSRFSLTKSSLKRALFHDNLAEVLITIVDQKLAGLALFSITQRNFELFSKPGLYLHEIYIEPTFRRQGLATGIKNELKTIALKRGLGRIDFVVLKKNALGLGLWASAKDAREVDYMKYMRIDLCEQDTNNTSET